MDVKNFSTKCMQYVYEEFLNADENGIQKLCDFFDTDEITLANVLSEIFEEDF